MKQNTEKDSNIKITSTDTNSIKEQIKTKDDRQRMNIDPAVVPEADYIQSECNPDNGAFFEERSNPLSSKGN